MEGTDLWSLKPWWCQPWSILLTGASVILAGIAGGRLLGSWWISVIPTVLVLGWWWLFLVVVPRSYRNEVAALYGDGGNHRPAGVPGDGSDPPA